MGGEHLIRKQRVVLKLGNKEEMFRVREWLHTELRESIIPEMDRLLSGICGDDRILSIPRLEIDLGRMDRKVLEKTFSEKFLEQAALQLEEQSALAGGFGGDGGSRAGNNGSARGISPAEQAGEALLFYLERGHLPWWFGKTDDAAGKNRKLRERLGDPALKDRLYALFTLRREARLRYLELAPGTETETLLSLARQQGGDYAGLTADLLAFRIHIKVRLGIGDQDFHDRLLLALSVFSRLQDPPGELKAFLRFFMGEMAALCSKDPGRVARMMQASLLLEENNLKLKVLDRTFWKEAFAETRDERTKRPQAGMPEGDPSAQAQSGEEKTVDPSGGWIVENAGLVLLHPFLPAFLEGQGLLGKDLRFMDMEAARHAAVLLQQIVKGEEEVFEHELLLNKLLCGLPPGEPVLPSRFPLTAAGSAEIETMLEAVAGHWEALKGSSPAALRETFLLRMGSVPAADDKILVRPERKTVDVLVDRLPWGLSVIKLPWLEIPVHVEW